MTSVYIDTAPLVSRRSGEYKLGCAQLRRWHEECRAKRLGIPFKMTSAKEIALGRGPK